MARLLCVAVSFFISLRLDACVSGSNVLVSPSPKVIPSRPPEECTSDSVSSVTVHFNTSTLTVDEGSNIDIQLVAQGTFCKNVTVNLTFTDGTARYLSDYFYNPLITPCVTFTPGSISSSVFRIITIPNNIWEGPKSFEVGFDFPPCPNLNSGRPDTLRVNIADDDSVRVSFQSSSITVREDSGCVQLQLQSSGLYGRRFSVSFRCIEVFPVEAKDGEDFTGGVYTVEFQTLGARSSFSSTAKLPIVNDSISECTKSFICVILRPRGEDGIVIEDPNTCTVVIEDDDSLEVSFEKAKYCGEEGGILSDIRLKATLFLTPFSVQIFATTLDASRPEKDCEATSGVDYTDPRFLPGGGVVQFNPAVGLLSTSLSIPLLPDNITECTKYFGLSFVAIGNGDCLGDITPVEPTRAIAAIKDSNAECSLPVTVHFNTSVLTVVEGSNIDIQLVAQGTFYKNFTVNLTFTDGTAKNLLDYFYNPLITPSVTFTPGSISSSVFRVITIQNNLCEGTKSFEVGFDLPPCPNVNSGRPDTLRVNIADDDSVHISFQRSTQTVREDSASVRLRLQSRGRYGRKFSVSLRCIEVFPVEAEDGEDFTGGVYTVEFQTLGRKRTDSSMVEIPIIDDMISEHTESFICVILRPRGSDCIVDEDPNTITVIIEDDDSLEVSFEKAEYSGEEGGILSDIRLKATPFGRPFSVQIFATALDASRPEKENEATSGIDYTDPRSLPGGGVVQFSPALGPLSTSLVIPLLSDNCTECTEYFGLSFVALTNGDDLGIMAVEPTMAMVAINDTNVAVVSFVKSNVTGGEGDVVKLRVKRMGCITEKLKCKVRIESTTAEKGVDFRVVTKSVMFRKLNVDCEERTVRVKLLSGNTNCFRVVLECKPRVLIGCIKPSATVCIQGN